MAALALGELAEIIGYNELPNVLATEVGGSAQAWSVAGKVAKVATGGTIAEETISGNHLNMETRGGKKRKSNILDHYPQAKAHRNFLPLEPQSNMGTFSRNASKSNVDSNTHGEEVAVMPVPTVVSKTMPDYFNINLPIVTQVVINTTNSGQTVGKQRLKLNQLDTIITGNNARARGQSQWTNIFEYYRVTQTDVKFTVQPRIASSAKAKDHLYMFGYHLNDTSSTADWNTYRDFGEAKQGGYKLMQPSDQGATFTTCQITYRPENWDLHVQESGIEERWTPVTAAPADPHYLHFGVVGAGPQGATVDASCIVLIEIIQHVQFREAKKSILNTEQTTD